MSGPRRRQNLRGEGTLLREELLEAAEMLLVARGSQTAVTVQAVCDAVGCTPPALYRYFDDKQALVLAVCDRLFDAYRDEVAKADRRSRGPHDRLRATGDAYITFALKNPGVYRVLFMHGPDEQPRDSSTDNSTASMFDHLRTCVTDCLPPSTPTSTAHEIAVQVWTVVHGVVSLVIAKPGFPWPGPSMISFAKRHAASTVEAIIAAAPAVDG